LEAFITPALLVAIAEIGDKTQLLSFMLAAKLRRPYPIMAGIFVLNWVVGLSFICFGLWALKPDQLDSDPRILGAGVFVTTLIAFFLAEMGDKTQFATVALAAHYDEMTLVVLGTTLGMMIANVPAVWLGEALAHRINMQWVRWFAAASFVLMGCWTLTGG
jgi:putative Ca2+/H+ antiporter (TMEM165/GDT1 family)